MSRIAENALPYATRPAVRIETTPLPDLSEQELLALVIGGGYASADAGLLLESYGGSLAHIYAASLEELVQNCAGIGQNMAKRIKAALELGRRLASEWPQRYQIGGMTDAAGYFYRAGLGLLDQEEVWIANLDTKNRVLHLSKPYRGNVNSSVVRAGEILRDAIRFNATAIIMAHNHPSGDPTPSPEDVQVTRSLREAARLMDIDLLDHLILSPNINAYVSLKERGLGFDR
ncbi:MAG: DNA repair protein RadC [Anaerolineales bacterium]|nr:DNA repair protein RadC [Anaerolineales bacterium]